MDPEEITDKLKNMTISTKGNIKEFNKEYKEISQFLTRKKHGKVLNLRKKELI